MIVEGLSSGPRGMDGLWTSPGRKHKRIEFNGFLPDTVPSKVILRHYCKMDGISFVCFFSFTFIILTKWADLIV